MIDLERILRDARRLPNYADEQQRLMDDIGAQVRAKAEAANEREQRMIVAVEASAAETSDANTRAKAAEQRAEHRERKMLELTRLATVATLLSVFIAAIAVFG